MLFIIFMLNAIIFSAQWALGNAGEGHPGDILRKSGHPSCFSHGIHAQCKNNEVHSEH